MNDYAAGGLPVLSGSVDHMRCGFRSLESEMGTAQHPVKRIQSQSKHAMWSSKLESVRRMHGSHMAMKLATEKEMFDRSHRLVGLQSSSIGCQTLMGTDDKIDFSDFLNVPNQRPDVPKLDIHSQMEIKLGIW